MITCRQLFKDYKKTIWRRKMKTKNKALNRALSFLLVLALIFGSIGITGRGSSEAYAAGGGTATVRIIDGDNDEVIANASVTIDGGITTIGAVVAAACQAEGRTFELNSYGFPATVGGVTLNEGYYWMSMLNDSGTAFNTGDFTNIAANDGDRIVLYADSWPSATAYSYFTVVTNGGVSVMPYGGTSYITGSVTLKLEKIDGLGTVSPCTGTALVLTDANGTVLSTASFDYGLPPNFGSIPVTSNSGSVKLELYGNCSTSDESAFEKTYIVSSNASGIVKPYCKIVMTASGMSFSQPIDSTGFRLTDPMVTHTTDIAASVQEVIDGIRDVNDIHAASYYDNDWALGMAAAGLTPTQAEKDNYLTWVLDVLADGGTSIATKAKTAIALTAFNIDARRVPNKNTRETINLIDTIAYSAPTGIDATWTAPFMLSLYDLGNYTVPTDAAVTRELLIGTIMAGKGADYWGTYGTDGTGTVMTALAPYYNSGTAVNGISAASCAAITSALDDAIDYLSSALGEYGGFPGWGGGLNSNTQAVVVTGLNSLGMNPHTSAKFYKSASAMDNLLSYKTADCKFGYSDNTAANDSASKQGMWALATYQNLSNSRSSNLYHFTKEIAPYTSWPDADLLTAIKITAAPSTTTYSYDASKTSFAPDTDGMVVTGIYNGDASNTTNVAISSCTISTINRAVAGTQTVTVSYQGCTATFMVTVKNSDGTMPKEDTVSVKVKNGKTVIASSNSVVIEKGKTTAMDVLKTVLDEAGIDYVIKGNHYVSEIAGLGEFDEGENSGWLYSVNGVTPPTTAASEYELEAGDAVVWYYTLDYTKDPSSSGWTPVTQGKNASAGTAAVEVAAKVDASGKATAAVSKDEMSKAIADAAESAEKAGEGAKAEVEIAVKGADHASSVETTIPKDSIKELNAKIDAVTVKTSVADIRLDKDTIKTLSAEASGDVRITVSRLGAADIANLKEEIRAEIGDKPVFDFSIKSGSKTISEFGGKVTVAVPYTAADQEMANGLVVYCINGQGSLEIIKNCIYDEKYFQTGYGRYDFKIYRESRRLQPDSSQ